MVLLLLLLLIPIVFAGLYIAHSVRQKRRKQAVAVGAVMLLNLGAAALLLYEYILLP